MINNILIFIIIPQIFSFKVNPFNIQKNICIYKYINDYEKRNCIISSDEKKIYVKKKYGSNMDYECCVDDIEEIYFYDNYEEYLL